MCRIKTVDSDQYKIEDYSDHAIRNEMSRAAKYEKWSKLEDKYIQCHPPLDIAKGVLALGTWDVPLIRGMIGAPVVREDGSILCSTGYDEATRLYYAQAEMLHIPEIPEYPTKEDANRAAQNIMDEVLHDFPFLDPASKANALAAFVTPIVRPMISGQTPIALIDKPAPGTGASKILDLISIIATGKEMAALSPADNEAEWRKLITGLLSDGTHIICFDNLDADLKAGTLSRALTSSIWKDRTLGKTDAVEYPQRACWYATGNNISLSGDLPRRAYMIQLDAKLERPWERKVDNFRHPKLNMWVAEHRGELLASLLIMARAWAIAGKPDGCKHVIGGFEDWVSVVGGVLKYAGIEGFLDNLVKLYEDSDSGNDEWADFFKVWYETHGSKPVFSSTLLMELENTGSKMSAAVPSELAEKIKFKGPGNSKKVGIFLRKKLNVRYKGGYMLTQKEDTDANSKTWIVMKTKDSTLT